MNKTYNNRIAKIKKYLAMQEDEAARLLDKMRCYDDNACIYVKQSHYKGWLDLAWFGDYEEFISFFEGRAPYISAYDMMPKCFEGRIDAWYSVAEQITKHINMDDSINYNMAELFDMIYCYVEGQGLGIVDSVVGRMLESYQGQYDSGAEFAQDKFSQEFKSEELERLEGYIDWSKVWEYKYSNHYFCVDGEERSYVFSKS